MTDTMLRPPAREDSSSPRRWAAGHVIVAVVVALLVGSVLNAQDLLATAERQEIGSTTRTVAVAFASPLARVSAALGLDRPRSGIDSALGRGVPDDVLIVAGDEDDETLPDGDAGEATPDDLADDEASATPTPTEEPELGRGPDRPVTADDPLRVYIGGDSMAGQFGPALEDTFFKTGVVETTEVKYEFESGFTRPDFVDWPARLAGVSAAQDPEVMVLIFGGNDAQPLKLDNVVYEPDTPEWQAEYRSRIAGVMDDLTDAGHILYWMGMPIPEDDDFRVKMEILNTIYAEEAAARGDAVRFFPTWELFAGPDGRYSEFLPDDDGDVVDMRLDDGIHLTTAGGYRAARAVAAQISDDFAFPDPPSDDG